MKVFRCLASHICTKLPIVCFSFMLNSSFISKWNRTLSIIVLLILFTFFVLFETMVEMPKTFRIPSPYSVIPLYPSRVPLLDLKHFAYVINNDVCQEKKMFAVVIVHSHPANHERRDAMRRNIPDEDLADLGMRRVFLLAKAEWDDQPLYTKTPQNQISEENVIHRDIVQGNFKEHYHNLTYKHIMGLQWVNTYCPQTKFIIKMDDDIIVDIYRFRSLLKSRYEHRKMLILGLLQLLARPIRNPKSKWYVSQSDFAQETYPNFLSGWAYAMTIDAATKITNLSQRVSYFWIDDVYVTGVLAEGAKVKREGLNSLYTIHSEHMRCCIELPKHTEYYCDYYVGPSGGDTGLMERVLSHARSCFVQPCAKRSFEERLSKTCVIAEDPNALNLGKGHGEVFKV